MRCRVALLFFLFSIRLLAEEVKLEDAGTFGYAQFVQLSGECGFLTPAHVFDSLRQPFLLQDRTCKVLSVRRFPGRDLLFFTADATGEQPMVLAAAYPARGAAEFRLPGPAVIVPEAWQGRSGTLGRDASGNPGLFLGLDRRTHERIFVRIDDSGSSEK